MHKRIVVIYFLFLVLLTILTNCEKKQWGEKIPSDMRPIPISAIYDNFKEYRGKRILIEGKIYKSLFPIEIFVNDGTGNIKIELRSEISSLEEKIFFISPSKTLTNPREALQKQKFARVMGTVDIDRDYPLGNILFGVRPIIIASGVELK